MFGRGSVACNLLRPIVHLRKTVQAVCAKWMTDGYARMLEAARLAHADSLHDRARTLIAERGERDDFRQIQPVEGHRERTRAASVAKPLCQCWKARRQPISHAGRKGQLGDWYMQAEEADELGGCLQLHGPEAPSSLLDQRLALIGQRIALVALERAGKYP